MYVISTTSSIVWVHSKNKFVQTVLYTALIIQKYVAQKLELIDKIARFTRDRVAEKIFVIEKSTNFTS